MTWLFCRKTVCDGNPIETKEPFMERQVLDKLQQNGAFRKEYHIPFLKCHDPDLGHYRHLELKDVETRAVHRDWIDQKITFLFYNNN